MKNISEHNTKHRLYNLHIFDLFMEMVKLCKPTPNNYIQLPLGM